MKKRNRPSSYRAIRWRITALVLGLWLTALVLLTWAVAVDMQMQIKNLVYQYAGGTGRNPSRSDEIPEDLPGSAEAGMIDHLGYPYFFLDVDPVLPIVTESNGVGSDDWIWGEWDLYYGYEAAVIYYDENGDVLMDSGNYLTFVYTTEENWKAQNVELLSYGYVDLDTVPGGMDAFDNLLEDTPTGSLGTRLWMPFIRLTGYFLGTQFHPVSIDRGDTRYSNSGNVAAMCRSDSRGYVQWTNLLTVEPPADRELETIYAWHTDGIRYSRDPVTVEGKRYDSLVELLNADRDSWGGYDSNSLLESVYVWNRDREDSFGVYTYAIAVRYWPLQYAMTHLFSTYLISLAAVALLLLLLLRKIRWNLTEPLEALVSRNQSGNPITPRAGWAEPRALEAHCENTRQAIHEANTQIAQLETALEYARNAEENRRQLISNITHELKTPLAVIHSYAEGLQAGIAGEKREHYLSVILEETEKTDAMVLQMLDLSRLEAGRVRLASDRFSLLALTNSVVEKLTPLAESRGLEFHYDITEEFDLTADEARIGQVVTNLVSNAVKYSDEGTQIQIKLYTHLKSAWFFIENVCPHLPQEAMEKVWDSFYRADPSRRSPGTGLGLTIVKTIVELHQGSCSVSNTSRSTEQGTLECVQFGFRLPIS